MKNGSKNWLFTGVIVATVLVVFIAVSVYINQLQKELSKSTLLTMQELILHDVQTIQANMESSWNELDRISTRLEQKQASNASELLVNLYVEQSVSSFEILYLVDTEGNIYSSSRRIPEASESSYIQRILDGEKHFAMYYSDDMGRDTFEQLKCIAYGITLNPIVVGDITVIGIVGMADIQLMDNKLNVDSFEGNGHTGVIDSDGYFIVDMENEEANGERKNIFELLSAGKLAADETLDGVEEKIQGDEFCTIQYTDEDGVEKVLASMEIPDSDWIILMSVNKAVFDEQNFEFIMMSTILLIVVVGAFLIMLAVIWKIMSAFARARADSKAKGDFLSSMSHEIRTPLNGLIGLIHLMQQNKDNPRKLDDYLEKSSSTAQYLITLVNDILDMQKLSQHSMVLEEETFSLQMMLDTIETLMRSRMEANGISFIVDLQLSDSAIVGDEVRIEQILMNILGNAVKFTPAGGSVKMVVRQSKTSEEKVTTVFEITDTGCGMSEAFQKHIFDSFSQESRKTSDGTKGTGLGMAISNQLSQLMGGKLQVKSKLNEGSTFTFELTAKCAEQLPEQTEKTPDNDRFYPLNILLAEDNDLNAEILIEVFTEGGYTVQRARNGQEAVDMFAVSDFGEYDLILMDVQMPVMDGYTATKMIRAMDKEDAKKVKIFACTANTFKEDRDKAVESGMDDFIAKPIDINVLLQKLNING